MHIQNKKIPAYYKKWKKEGLHVPTIGIGNLSILTGYLLPAQLSFCKPDRNVSLCIPVNNGIFKKKRGIPSWITGQSAIKLDTEQSSFMEKK